MNPSFMAMQKALARLFVLACTGKTHEPKPKGKIETSINGRAFAPGKGVQQEVSSDEKEAKVQAQLTKLRDDVRTRAGIGEVFGKPGLDPVSPKVRKAIDDAYQYRVGTSDMVTAACDRLTAKAAAFYGTDPRTDAEIQEDNAKLMTALYGSDNGVKITEDTPHDIVVRELHRTHAAYIERQIALNRRNTAERQIPLGEVEEPKYPTSDLIDAFHEHIEEQQAQAEAHAELKRERDAEIETAITDRIEACIIHTGERRNTEE